MKKLKETGRLGIAIVMVSIFAVWGVYFSYLFEPLKDLYIPMMFTAIMICGGLLLYWFYQVDSER